MIFPRKLVTDQLPKLRISLLYICDVCQTGNWDSSGLSDNKPRYHTCANGLKRQLRPPTDQEYEAALQNIQELAFRRKSNANSFSR